MNGTFGGFSAIFITSKVKISDNNKTPEHFLQELNYIVYVFNEDSDPYVYSKSNDLFLKTAAPHPSLG